MSSTVVSVFFLSCSFFFTVACVAGTGLVVFPADILGGIAGGDISALLGIISPSPDIISVLGLFSLSLIIVSGLGIDLIDSSAVAKFAK